MATHNRRPLDMAAIKRCLNEKVKLDDESSSMNFLVFPETIEGFDAYRYWDVFILGYENTLYHDKLLHAQIEIVNGFPVHPPKMKFISKMYHPNVYPNGDVCISILTQNNEDVSGYIKSEDTWSPIQGFRTIILSVVSMLNEPNVESPANIDAARTLRDEPEKYKELVQNIAEKESVKSIERLKAAGLYHQLFDK